MFQERLHKTSTHSSHRKNWEQLGTVEATNTVGLLRIPVYSVSQCTQYPSVLSIPVYSVSQCTQYPSVLRIPVYSGSQCTQDPSVLSIPVYSGSQCTQDPSVLRIPVYCFTLPINQSINQSIKPIYAMIRPCKVNFKFLVPFPVNFWGEKRKIFFFKEK